MSFTQSQLFGTARQRGGYSARASGREFEKAILASQRDGQGQVCVLAHIKNFAKRIPAGSDWERRTGERFRMVEEKSPFDFAGVVVQGAIGLFIDAKSFEDDASFRVHRPEIVKRHQLQALEALEIGGAFAGFLVRCGRFKDVRWCWATHAAATAAQDKPMQWADPRWEILGSFEWGRPIPLRRLFERYQ